MNLPMINVIVIENNESDFLRVKAAICAYEDKIRLVNVKTLSDAMESLSKNYFDLILVDTQLPDATGASIIRQLKKVTDAYIVVLTNDDSDGMIMDAIRCGAFNYLHKSEMNGNLRRAILAAKIKSDLNREKREKIVGMLRYYFPTSMTTETTDIEHTETIHTTGAAITI